MRNARETHSDPFSRAVRNFTLSPFRVAVLASGRGSNLLALIDAQRKGVLSCEIVGVFSDKPDCDAIAKAMQYGIPVTALRPKDCASRAAFDQQMFAAIAAVQPDLIVCAGYMRIISEFAVQQFEGRIINIHPSLLPKYPGVDTHEKVLAAGDPVHGCSVHFVTAGVDEGPVIGRAEVDVKPGDTTETLAARVLKAEHLLYPRCVAAVAAGWDGLSQFERVDVEGDVVRLTVPR